VVYAAKHNAFPEAKHNAFPETIIHGANCSQAQCTHGSNAQCTSRNAFLEEKHIALLEILNILGKENRLEFTNFSNTS
jgi:hypothetical protein